MLLHSYKFSHIYHIFKHPYLHTSLGAIYRLSRSLTLPKQRHLKILLKPAKTH